MKIAAITGAGSGIGKNAAEALYAEGYALVLAGRTKSKLEAVFQELGADESRILCIPTDVSHPDSVKNLFAETKAKFGRLDLLFNNAGISLLSDPLDEVSYEDWQKIVGINLTGVFLCTQEAFRLMKSQDPMGGRIINNGSISAQVPRLNSAPYTATKHAVTGLTKSTSLDGRKYNIACGQIDIGNALTNMAQSMTTGMPQANGEMAIEPTMHVKHIGQAIVYMANLPLEANVLFMTVMASGMPFVGRG